MYYLWIAKTVSKYLKEQGLSWSVDELPPHDRARVSRTDLEPGPCQQLPKLPFPLFLGHRHLAMLIFTRHSIANQAGFVSPHPS
jgi:hypothetical protein